MSLSTSGDQRVLLTWLGTAGFRLQYRDTQLLIDPHLTRPCPAGRPPLTASQAARSDGLLVTHGHFDHAMDVPCLASAGRQDVLAPEIVCRRLQQFGVDRTRLFPNEKVVFRKIKDVKVDVLPSRHIRYDLPLVAMTLWHTVRNRCFTEVLGLALSWPLGSNSDFLLQCGEVTVYHAGSLGARPDQRVGLEPDVALLPCAGRSDMVGPLLSVCDAMRPKTVILHHHDLFWPGFVLPQPVGLVADLMARRRPRCDVQVARQGQPMVFGP